MRSEILNLNLLSHTTKLKFQDIFLKNVTLKLWYKFSPDNVSFHHKKQHDRLTLFFDSPAASSISNWKFVTNIAGDFYANSVYMTKHMNESFNVDLPPLYMCRRMWIQSEWVSERGRVWANIKQPPEALVKTWKCFYANFIAYAKIINWCSELHEFWVKLFAWVGN